MNRTYPHPATNHADTLAPQLDKLEPRLLLSVGDAPSLTGIGLAPDPVLEGRIVYASGMLTETTDVETTVEVDWGNGGVDVTTLLANRMAFFLDTKYADDGVAGTASDVYTVTFTATNVYGSASETRTITVNNAAPTITDLSIDEAVVNKDGSLTLIGVFTDRGTLDEHTATIDWGDGSAPETVTVTTGERSFSATHLFGSGTAVTSRSATGGYTVNVTVTDDDTGSDTASIEVAAAANTAPSDTTLTLDEAIIDEGGTAMLSGTFVDPDLADTFTVTIDWGDGSAVETITVGAGERSFAATHPYLDDDPSGTSADDYAISVTVTDDSGGVDTAETAVTVANVAPVIVDVVVDPSDTANTVTASGSFTDVGTVDTHTVVIDWGDGTTSDAIITASGGSGTFAAEHVYDAGGMRTVSVTVADDDTGADTAAGAAVISGVTVNDGVLQIIGTDAKDRVKINRTGNGRLKVHAGFLSDGKHQTFDAEGIEKIEIQLGDGNDKAHISGNIDLLTVMDGGAGNDRLKAGRGPTAMVGGAGNDKLIGGKGSDILIGGDGRDRLVGGGGDDVLIGGATTFDADHDSLTDDFDAPLLAMLAEWNSDRDYDTRVANLTGVGDGERLNEDFFLDDTTVLGSQAGDKINGGSGENWYVDIMSANGKRKGAATADQHHKPATL